MGPYIRGHTANAASPGVEATFPDRQNDGPTKGQRRGRPSLQEANSASARGEAGLPWEANIRRVEVGLVARSPAPAGSWPQDPGIANNFRDVPSWPTPPPSPSHRFLDCVRGRGEVVAAFTPQPSGHSEMSIGQDPKRPARKRPLATKKAADKPNPLVWSRTPTAHACPAPRRGLPHPRCARSPLFRGVSPIVVNSPLSL